ncbi:MAG: rhodanese family protein [Oceanibaculum nanhaiense]|uniref:rhodanese family protein n=1 Tax=Oceanibaculum nanhaiense TaxID=1909734 RepID=UPI0025A46ACD|nr:rhodanese family protein [Oceanibaculum nanhaiense]MDM7945023.1 rhodanese family protein [Oceanibaculum nanhaiense]
MLHPIAPDALQQRLASGEMLLIDIREPDEYAREHIIGARLIPLNAIDAEDLTVEHSRAVCFTCRSGNRTAIAAARLLAKGFPESYALEGGLDGWKKAGLPVHFNPRAPLDLMRQVQIAAGSLALAGAVLAATVSPWFILLSGFVGAGLVFAGLTGFCGMARLLKRMPWNRASLA